LETGMIVLAIVIGYLLGSIPFAYIAGRLIKGIDIRKVGGGNMGSLNVIREIGPVYGYTVMFFDVAKGVLAVLIAQWLDVHLYWVFAAGFAAIVGHNWPVWLKFRGGQGLATTMGVLLPLVPIEFACSFGILIIVILITSNVRLSAAVGLAFLPLFVWLFRGSEELPLILYSLALPVFCVLKSMTRIGADLTNSDTRKSFIFDRQHKPWQTKR
jgi:glycerol-3-phosphate acyltransferase PlsY